MRRMVDSPCDRRATSGLIGLGGCATRYRAAAARTMATMPARRAAGNVGHARRTASRSGSRSIPSADGAPDSAPPNGQSCRLPVASEGVFDPCRGYCPALSGPCRCPARVRPRCRLGSCTRCGMQSSRSPRDVMRVAHRPGNKHLAQRASRFSRRDFALPQLFARPALRPFHNLGCRRAAAPPKGSPKGSPGLRRAVRPRRAPDHNTRCDAFGTLARLDVVAPVPDGPAAAFGAAGLLRPPGCRPTTPRPGRRTGRGGRSGRSTACRSGTTGRPCGPPPGSAADGKCRSWSWSWSTTWPSATPVPEGPGRAGPCPFGPPARAGRP